MIRDRFMEYTEMISREDGSLRAVYNNDINSFTRSSEIRYILLADNPGREEAAANRYLIGQAGKQARNFFRESGLTRSFEDEVLVLNKTCIHTCSTGELRGYVKNRFFTESQAFMAGIAHELHVLLKCEMWIIGCSEFRPGGLFSKFRDTVKEMYLPSKMNSLRNSVYCYKHFSYGNFSHDLKIHESGDLRTKLQAIGTEMRMRFLGW